MKRYLQNIFILTLIFFSDLAISANTISLTTAPPTAAVQSAMLRNWQAQKWDTVSLTNELKSNLALTSITSEIEIELQATDSTMVALDEVKTKPPVNRRTARQIIDKLQKHENKFEKMRKQLSTKQKEIESQDQKNETVTLVQKINKLYQLVSSITRVIHEERQTMVKTML